MVRGFFVQKKREIFAKMWIISYICNMKVRNVIAYKHYFIDFVRSLPEKMQDKIIKTIEYVEILQMIPEKYLKHIEGTKGLYEIRAKFSSDIVRVFCFFDGEKLVVLLRKIVQ